MSGAISVNSEIKEQVDEEHLMAEESSYQSCCLCLEGIELQNLLVEHIQLYHQNEILDQSYGSLQCCNCNEGIKIQLQLINHLLSHITLVKEEVPSEIDEIQQEQEEELGVDRSSSKPSYKNRYNRRERSPETQKLQLSFTFDESSKLYHCNFCRNGYKHKQTVERHLSKAHDPRKARNREKETSNTPQFNCHLCSNGYKHKQTLERHLEREHNVKKAISKSEESDGIKPKEEKSLTCDLCGKGFTFRESLRKHLINHTSKTHREVKSTVVEKVVCHLCPAIVRRDLIKRHIRNIHTDFRPFACQEVGCTTTFTDSTKLNDHRNWHLKIKNYVCQFCQEEFYFQSNWRQHLLRHVDPERYKCDVCSECFVSRGSLLNHLRTHDDSSSQKTFVCDSEHCGKSFRFENQLKQHFYNVHRMEPNQKCKLCDFVTSRRKYINKHMLKVHNIREGNPRSRVFPKSH